MNFLKKKQIGNWLIEFDYEATKNAYTNIMQKTNCSCHTCRNYENAISAFPDEVHNFFNELGIDLSKPAEVYEFAFENSIVHMGGWYHIIGNYLEGDDAWQTIAPDHSHQKTTEMHALSDGFQVGFTHMVALIKEEFSHPVIQMEINFYVPWVLDETYNQKPLTKKEWSEINKKAYKRQLLEKLKEILDITKIDENADLWDIDTVNHMGVEVFDSGTIVYFSDEHQHFWEHDNCDDYEFVNKTFDFIKDLLAGQTRFDRTYRGKKLVRVAYYTKSEGVEAWILQQNFGTAIFRPLFHYPKKITQSEIIEFRQQ